jgi:hypothetical protein
MQDSLGRGLKALVAVRSAEEVPEPLPTPHVLPANLQLCEVEPRGFEPLTSAVQRRHDALLELSTDFKISANPIFLAIVHFLSFQIIYSGCCTVAALGRLLMGCWM